MSSTEPRTVPDLLQRAASRWPDHDAVVFPAERCSFAELEARAELLARGLLGLGLEPGENVGLLLPNSLDAAAAFFAVSMAGGVVVPINIRFRAVEIPHIVADADLRIVLTSDRIDDHVDLAGLLSASLPGLADASEPRQLRLADAPGLRSVVVLGSRAAAGMFTEDDLLRAATDTTVDELPARRGAIDAMDDAMLLYTSGTTSLPRGCRLVHDALVRNWQDVADVLSLAPRDRIWDPCPLFHIAGIGPLLATVARGAAFVTDTFFDAGRAVTLIERERPTVLYPAYPPLVQGLLEQDGFARLDLSDVRTAMVVAPPETLRAYERRLGGLPVVTLYGMTEASGCATYTRPEESEEERLDTCGRPMSGVEVRIVDPETRGARATERRGEIALRGSTLFRGYRNDAEKTANAIDADGWFFTGDEGAVDAGGRLKFYGRLRDTLKIGGENVAPAEVEAHLSTHPAVRLVQVVGVPDARLDEVVAAFVELQGGADVTADELIEFCRDRLASFKVPRYVRFVTEWPMSATKIRREPLRAELIDELASVSDGPGALR